MKGREIIEVDGVNYEKSVWEDPNFQAFRLAQARGEFTGLAPGSFVAFQKGTLIGWDENLSDLMDRITGLYDPEADLFVEQVNLDEPTLEIRGPRVVR